MESIYDQMPEDVEPLGAPAMSVVLMEAQREIIASLRRQVEQLSALNAELTEENERVRNLLTEFDRRHDADQARIAELEDAASPQMQGRAGT